MKYFVEYSENEIKQFFKEYDAYKKAMLKFKDDEEMFEITKDLFMDTEKIINNIYLVKE